MPYPPLGAVRCLATEGLPLKTNQVTAEVEGLHTVEVPRHQSIDTVVVDEQGQPRPTPWCRRTR